MRNLEQSVAAVEVGSLVFLHQAVKGTVLKALEHQRASPRQPKCTKLSLGVFQFNNLYDDVKCLSDLVSDPKHHVIIVLPPLEQRGLVNLRLEVYREPPEAGDAVGEADGEDDRLHALDGEGLPDHGLGGVHQGDHARVGLDVEELGPSVVVGQPRQVALQLLQVLGDLRSEMIFFLTSK